MITSWLVLLMTCACVTVFSFPFSISLVSLCIPRISKLDVLLRGKKKGIWTHIKARSTTDVPNPRRSHFLPAHLLMYSSRWWFLPSHNETVISRPSHVPSAHRTSNDGVSYFPQETRRSIIPAEHPAQGRLTTCTAAWRRKRRAAQRAS